MSKYRLGVLLIIALFALISVASAALPTQITASLNNPGTFSYWDVNVLSKTPSGATTGITNTGLYVGWCHDSVGTIGESTYYFKPYSSIPYIGAVVLPSGWRYANWSAINYIINHRGSYAKNAVQNAIWFYDGGGSISCTGTLPGTCGADYTALMTDVNDNAGGNYQPGLDPGATRYAIILIRCDVNGNEYLLNQQIFVESKDKPIPPPMPEFPSVALPLGMLIGVMGIVFFIKEH